MKAFIKKILFKGISQKPFFGVRIFNGRIEEKVFLEDGVFELDVSLRHNIVCENPFCVAIWISELNLTSFRSDRLKLKIVKGRKVMSLVKIKLIKKLEQDNGVILIVQIKNVRCFQLDLLHQFILIVFFFSKKRHTYKEAKIYGAAYSYPRKVIVASFRDEEYFNIF